MAIGERADVGCCMRHIGLCVSRIASALFGCQHRRYSWPQGRGMNCHVSCLECGTQFPYDWQQMRRVKTGRKTA